MGNRGTEEQGAEAAREDKQGCWGMERHQLIAIQAKEI